MIRRHAAFAIACLVSLVATAIPAHGERRAVVSHIDHFVVEDSQAEELFKLFTDQFRLPTIWPMPSYGSFRSGGVYFGNVVVEVGHFGNAADTGHAQWAGIVFAPRESAVESVAELDARHIHHGPLDPYVSKPQGSARARKNGELARLASMSVALVAILKFRLTLR